MPLTAKGEEILSSMKKQYGSEKKAKEVFYASANKGTITGVHDEGCTCDECMKANDTKMGRGVLPEVNYTSKNKPPLPKSTVKSSEPRANALHILQTKRALGQLPKDEAPPTLASVNDANREFWEARKKRVRKGR